MKINNTNTEITAALLHGSRNIDRMREEIHELICMIMGFILRPLVLGTEINETFESTNCKWDIRCKIGHKGCSKAECWVRTNSGLLLAYMHDSGMSDMRQSEDLQTVYESLPVFVDGVIRKFPDITKSWQFLIDASQVKFY